MALGGEDHVLQWYDLRGPVSNERQRDAVGATRTRMVATGGDGVKRGPRNGLRSVSTIPSTVIDLRETWWIGPVEIPTRLVLAPDGRRQRAGVPPPGPPLRCGPRVLRDGQLCRDRAPQRAHARLPPGRVRRAPARDPALRLRAGDDGRGGADGQAAGADLVDLNFGCPVRKVTKTGAGATLLDDPDHAARIVSAIADAVEIPVTVKLRRGLRDGSRDCLVVGPRLVEAGAASLTLHPRSAQQMYTGTADHGLTAELVSLVDVPVVASGDIVSRAKAQTVLATTGASAVMIGRAARGIRGCSRRSSTAAGASLLVRRSSRSSSSSSGRPSASSGSGARAASSRSSTPGTSAAGGSHARSSRSSSCSTRPRRSSVG